MDLTEFSTEALLDAIVRLTHCIHGRGDGDASAAQVATWRAQRDLARAEVIRRAG